LCHDLGKATAFFQAYLQPGWNGDAQLKAHALFGAMWVIELLRRAGDMDAMLTAGLHMAFVRSHHGRLDDLRIALSMSPDEERRCQQRLAAADVTGLVDWLRSQLSQDDIQLPDFTDKQLGSVRRKLDPVFRAKLDPDIAMGRFQKALRDFGCLIAADRESAAGEAADPTTEFPHLTRKHVDQFRTLGEFGPSGNAMPLSNARDAVYRAAVSGARRQPAAEGKLWTLEVPTGAGKTLAALGWATERRRLRQLAGSPAGAIFYALPFTSIIDQTAAVIHRLGPEAGEPQGLAVHHHLADYGVGPEERNEGGRKREWAETWRADVVCTTFVQIAHAFFHGTAADARRFAALTEGSVLILDEAQALPAELWPTLRIALRSLAANFCVDVLLLTATQPALLTSQDPAEDLSPRPDAKLPDAFDRYDVYIESDSTWGASALVEAAARAVTNAEARSALLLLNTINEALAVYFVLRRHSSLGEIPVYHLSTNLRPKDRAAILTELVARERLAEPRLLVATQVVEAGVDLSFDLVFRAKAPLDAIVQAAGRCNRHGSGPRGKVCVFSLEGQSAHRIYGNIKMAAANELMGELAAAFPSQPIPEPMFAATVPEFFKRVASRMGEAQDRLRVVIEAVTAFEFAQLRGEPDRTNKEVELIVEEGTKVPVFIEMDEEDAYVWQQLVAAYALPDFRQRRSRLRQIRAAVGARVVEVPKHLNPPPVTAEAPLAYLSRLQAAAFYDVQTGWRRNVSVIL
jgi:CRISPR-associated endonuclease/helicase Cas3